jgi:predicted membrane chloride channel (bestrophin family)
MWRTRWLTIQPPHSGSIAGMGRGDRVSWRTLEARVHGGIRQLIKGCGRILGSALTLLYCIVLYSIVFLV